MPTSAIPDPMWALRKAKGISATPITDSNVKLGMMPLPPASATALIGDLGRITSQTGLQNPEAIKNFLLEKYRNSGWATIPNMISNLYNMKKQQQQQ